MEIKKFINKVKDKHNEIKEKISQPKKTVNNKKCAKDSDEFNPEDSVKKGLGLKKDIFVPHQMHFEMSKQKDYIVEKGDSLESIAIKFYSDSNKWIMIHRANFIKIPNPYHLITGIILDIPEEGTIDNFYPKYSNKGNYIIQPNDTVVTIARNIFCSVDLMKKLVDWGFLKYKKDIYPGKEIEGLKYLNLKSQLLYLAKKNNFQVQQDNISPLLQKKILLTAIAVTARDNNVPPVVAMSISSPDIHWMNFQGTEEEICYDKNNINWQPMQLNEHLYKDAFPNVAMNIEMNIHYGITVLKNLRQTQKNWPKAIVAYYIDSPPGIGKPAEQKKKALSGIKVLNESIIKMENPEFKALVIAHLKHEDDNDISYELLFKELIKYRDFIEEKYL